MTIENQKPNIQLGGVRVIELRSNDDRTDDDNMVLVHYIAGFEWGTGINLVRWSRDGIHQIFTINSEDELKEFIRTRLRTRSEDGWRPKWYIKHGESIIHDNWDIDENGDNFVWDDEPDDSFAEYNASFEVDTTHHGGCVVLPVELPTLVQDCAGNLLEVSFQKSSYV
jgi:hypothetical protein